MCRSLQLPRLSTVYHRVSRFRLHSYLFYTFPPKEISYTGSKLKVYLIMIINKITVRIFCAVTLSCSNISLGCLCCLTELFMHKWVSCYCFCLSAIFIRQHCQNFTHLYPPLNNKVCIDKFRWNLTFISTKKYFYSTTNFCLLPGNLILMAV